MSSSVCSLSNPRFKVLFYLSIGLTFLLGLSSVVLSFYNGNQIWSIPYTDLVRDSSSNNLYALLKDFLDCKEYSQYFIGPKDAPSRVVDQTSSVLLDQCLTHKMPSVFIVGITAAAQLFTLFFGFIDVWKHRKWTLALFSVLSPVSIAATILSVLWVSYATSYANSFLISCSNLDPLTVARLQDANHVFFCYNGPQSQPIANQANRTAVNWLNSIQLFWIGSALVMFSQFVFVGFHVWRYITGLSDQSKSGSGLINAEDEQEREQRKLTLEAPLLM